MKKGNLLPRGGVKKIVDAIRRPMWAGFLTMVFYLTVVGVWNKEVAGIIINVATGLALWWLVAIIKLPDQKEREGDHEKNNTSND